MAALETAYEQLVEKVAAGSKITGQLEVFAAQLAADKITVEAYLQSQGDKHRQELGALDALFQAKLAALEASLQAKLGMVEGAFGHCDKALSELQQQSYAATAASSSGHVPTDGPSIGPIRARLDEMARADLIRDNILADLDTRLVSLAYSQCDADQKMAASRAMGNCESPISIAFTLACTRTHFFVSVRTAKNILFSPNSYSL